MKLSPFVNAILATIYICAVVLAIQILTGAAILAGLILIPIIMLSLLVLSVAIMAFLFFYQPVRLLLDGRPDDALRFFFVTIALFAVAIGIVIGVTVTALFF